jgi:hypothetical protein
MPNQDEFPQSLSPVESAFARIGPAFARKAVWLHLALGEGGDLFANL